MEKANNNSIPRFMINENHLRNFLFSSIIKANKVKVDPRTNENINEYFRKFSKVLFLSKAEIVAKTIKNK